MNKFEKIIIIINLILVLISAGLDMYIRIIDTRYNQMDVKLLIYYCIGASIAVYIYRFLISSINYIKYSYLMFFSLLNVYLFITRFCSWYCF